MSRDFKKELEGFEAVWKRVTQSKVKLPEKLKLMPQKNRNRCGRGRRPGM